LEFWGKYWDDLQREFGGLYHRAKFGWNRISCFDNTKVGIFCAFGLKTLIHAFLAVLGVKIKKTRKMHGKA